MSSAMNITRGKVLVLYKSLLLSAKLVDNYNFRAHAIRKVKYSFRQRHADIEAAYVEGEKGLDLLRRMIIVGHLYPEDKSVMEAIEKK